jgi:hypothetical protein
MRLAVLCHTEMTGELVTLWAAVSSTTESVLGRSPNDIFHMEGVGELAAEFQKVEERCLWRERLGARICDLLLRPPSGQARLANHMHKIARQLRADLAAWHEVDVELEALQTLAARV